MPRRGPLVLVVAALILAGTSVSILEYANMSSASHPPVTSAITASQTYQASTSAIGQASTSAIGQSGTTESGSLAIESDINGSGLQLTATIEPTKVSQGENISVIAQVYDRLSSSLNVSSTSFVNSDYGPCAQGFATGVQVYRGQYTSANVSEGHGLLLYNPSLVYLCPAEFTFQYSFEPNSDNATVVPSLGAFQDPNMDTTGPVNETSVLAGYWIGTGQGFLDQNGDESQAYAFNTFQPGTYTVVVDDAWGQKAIGNFQVTGISLQNFSLCSSDCVYPSPYLSGEIYLGPSLTSLELYVNGTSEGSLGSNIGDPNVVFQYQGTFQSPKVIPGDSYVIKFVAIFEDSSPTTVTTTVAVPFPDAQTVVALVKVGDIPYGAAYDPAKGEVFVVNSGDNTVSVISDTNDTVVTTVQVGSQPVGAAYDSAKGEVFVVDSGDDSVSVISDRYNQVVANIAVGASPDCIAYDPARGELFVGNELASTVSVISDSTDTVVATVALPEVITPGQTINAIPYAVAYDGARGEVFVANNDNTVSVISDSSDTVVATVTLLQGSFPYGLAYDSAKGEVFVIDMSADTVFAISDTNDTVVATVEVGGLPNAVAYDPAKGEVFIAFTTSLGSDKVSVISDSTDAVVATVALPLGDSYFGAVYDSAKGELFFAGPGNDYVSVISDGISASTTTYFTIP
jgi:YVTN family beta-propeller protein